MDNAGGKDSLEMNGLMAFPRSVGSAIIKPEDLGKIRGKSMAAMRDQTQRQLNQLYAQMQTLVDQAAALKTRVEISENIYNSNIPFEPVVGQDYFMYKRDNGTHFLSMISPEEWGKPEIKKQFQARVTLLSDHTWEVHT
jgi:hypothetical protein